LAKLLHAFAPPTLLALQSSPVEGIVGRSDNLSVLALGYTGGFERTLLAGLVIGPIDLQQTGFGVGGKGLERQAIAS
jgi:hypothetical protein